MLQADIVFVRDVGKAGPVEWRRLIRRRGGFGAAKETCYDDIVFLLWNWKLGARVEATVEEGCGSCEGASETGGHKDCGVGGVA